MICDGVRGEKEQLCLDRVRRQFDVKNCFGFSLSDLKKMETYLIEAIPNPQNNEFPDFLFPCGFIEHFQITSSHESKKGSSHIKESAKFDREFDKRCDAYMAETTNMVKNYSDAHQYKGHSHNNLVASFKKNWENHIQSLKKAPKSIGEIGIFMVQYSDKALDMHGQLYDSSDKANGPTITEVETINSYKLSRDKKLLEYVFPYKDDIQYVIFVNPTEIEVISVYNLEVIMKGLEAWDFCIAQNYTMKIRSAREISIPDEIDGDNNE